MRIQSMALTLCAFTAIGALIQCDGGTRVDLDHPPALSNFAWDRPLTSTVANLEQAGWKRRESTGTEGRLEFVPALIVRDEAQDDIPEAPTAASIALYSQNDSLKVVHILRQGNRDTIRNYVEHLSENSHYGAPVWESEPRENQSPTGNRITRQERLFQTPDVWITCRLSYVETADAQLADATISEVELQFFGKKTNEGLSQEALTNTLQQEQ